MTTELIPGHCTMMASKQYVSSFGKDCAEGHYSDFLNVHLRLSSIGIGARASRRFISGGFRESARDLRAKCSHLRTMVHRVVGGRLIAVGPQGRLE